MQGLINGRATTKHRKKTEIFKSHGYCCASLVQELMLTLELEVHTHIVIFFPKVYTLLKIIRQEINLFFAENTKKVFFNNHACTAIS